MNKILTIVLLSLITINTTYAQNVIIPDANFKAYLVADTAINTNADTEIQVTEASAYSGHMYISSTVDVANLTGIEAFNNLTSLQISENTNLTTINLTGCAALTSFICTKGGLTSLNISTNTNLEVLSCWDNNLTSLNVSNNTALKQLLCHTNNIPSLDVSTNVALEKLLCSNNPLGTLNVATNTSLTELGCSSNNLSTIDVSNNLLLDALTCNNNQLTDIDLSVNNAIVSFSCINNSLLNLNVANGNNAILQSLRTVGNPNLYCIKVDSGYTPPTGTYNFAKAANASYNTSCAINTAVSSIQKEQLAISVYPNPTSGQLTLDLFAEPQDIEVEVSNIMGQTVLQQQYTNTQRINLELEGASGLYFVNIKSKKGLNKTVSVIKK